MLTKPFPFIDCNKFAFAHVVVVVAVKGARADGKTPDGQKYSDVCELDEVKSEAAARKWLLLLQVGSRQSRSRRSSPRREYESIERGRGGNTRAGPQYS